MSPLPPLPRILLVDDDPVLTAMLQRYLAREGFNAEAANDMDAGMREALDGGYALIVLEIAMARRTGLDALSLIRAHSQVPVLVVTAHDDLVDRIVGLDQGADDYISKPCAPAELAARIRAILRRIPARGISAPAVATRSLELGELTLWPGSRRTAWRGAPLALTGTEFSLLYALARHGGQPVSKDTLSHNAFGRPLDRFDRRIDVHISSIRQKLGPRADGQSWIVCIRGRGYQLLKD